MARMTLNDFDTALQRRGFDGFEPDDRQRAINWAYREVARLTRWRWEEADVSVTFAAGEYRKSTASDLPTVKSVRAVVVTTAQHEARLAPMGEGEFYSNWAALDLSADASRGEPSQYYFNGAYLYVLPPPRADRAVKVTAEQQVTDLTDGTDVPVTPADFDEAIFLAAEKRCHLQAREGDYAAENRRELNSFYDDALTDEAQGQGDLQARVIPGRTCL